ncbi:hypothetical protein [Pseudonocardia kunmingensis]|uniref:Uncharacterized protein n=1 Tax=Pseudonocardia kunmingensis TaxID=630975 RepID=A0A543DQ49_9PSEU|nr:hypothetical protein [Pseudonocardia kunmingensis]TQM11460.1 hypothetical protein FB558_4023 [Pseudonocardia kunmingensis]
MTRWAASDFRPDPTITTLRPGPPGLLVLVTDGLRGYPPTPDALAGKLVRRRLLRPGRGRQSARADRPGGRRP